MNHSAMTFYLIIALGGVKVMDLVSTYLGIALNISHESNPIVVSYGWVVGLSILPIMFGGLLIGRYLMAKMNGARLFPIFYAVLWPCFTISHSLLDRTSLNYLPFQE